MNPFDFFLRDDLLLSTRLMLGVDVIAGVGVLVAFVTMWFRRAAGASTQPTFVERIVGTSPFAFLALVSAGMFLVQGQRWAEVNHFPSQTMSEVLTMFTLALSVSMVALHFALGLSKRSRGWAAVDDALIALVLLGIVATHMRIRTMPTAQRDLPPALQSYWFAPHLSCLIFSYATMSIAALIALTFFLTRFWSGVIKGGQTRASQYVILGLLVLVPFVQVVTVPMLVISGLVFLWMSRRDLVPNAAGVTRLEKELDDVSFRAFAVGFPFLTAGLWMGSFWAQEAWANYWGWDSKENSALITWLVYVVYIHLRMLGGWRGTKAMTALVGGALCVFFTFQLFGFMPDSQKSLHRYTDDGVQPQEGQQGPSPATQEARAEAK